MIFCPKCGTFSVAGDNVCLNCSDTVIYKDNSSLWWNIFIFGLAILVFSGYFWAIYDGLIIF
jgi:hypothetical protein